jgi:23S rRNA (uridine2552-2'-O)-methyltransferase
VSGRGNPYQKADRFTVAAKQAGFPARSVFKLEEIDRRVKLLRGGNHVLDLGAAPGSWSLYAANKVSPSGKLLAMDLQELNTTLPNHATFFQGDALALDNEALSMFAPYDVVLSDMAPNTSGNRLADQARSCDLFLRALRVAEAMLKPGGHFVGKIFMGEDFPLARKEVKLLFGEERLIRPEGVRQNSFEIFVVGLGRKLASAKEQSVGKDGSHPDASVAPPEPMPNKGTKPTAKGSQPAKKKRAAP